MRKIIFTGLLCALVLCLAGCTKKWEWTVPLAVNSTEVNIPSNLSGHIYIPIYSTVTWDLSFDYGEGYEGPEWLHPDITSGKGYNVCVRVEYDANPFHDERTAEAVIIPRDTSTGAETIRIRLIQPATK